MKIFLNFYHQTFRHGPLSWFMEEAKERFMTWAGRSLPVAALYTESAQNFRGVDFRYEWRVVNESG